MFRVPAEASRAQFRRAAVVPVRDDRHRAGRHRSGEQSMIIGAHVLLFSTDADADRAFLQEVLGTRSVDAGGGWLILALPPAEIAVHPTDGPPQHELYLMCDDIQSTIENLTARGASVDGDVSDQGWGLLINVRLPSGAPLGVYEPRHPVAFQMSR
jgi:predicted enzyme related to lactoylglutathione lyase